MSSCPICYALKPFLVNIKACHTLIFTFIPIDHICLSSTITAKFRFLNCENCAFTTAITYLFSSSFKGRKKLDRLTEEWASFVNLLIVVMISILSIRNTVNTKFTTIGVDKIDLFTQVADLHRVGTISFANNTPRNIPKVYPVCCYHTERTCEVVPHT